MKGWIDFESGGITIHAEVDDGERRFSAKGEIEIPYGTMNKTKIASTELDNLVFGLDKIAKRNFFGEKI